MMNSELELTMWMRVRWEKGSRYYEAYVHQDLWGAWVLTRSWGRRRTRLGRTVHLACLSYPDARDRLAALDRRRMRRGYTIVSAIPEPKPPCLCVAELRPADPKAVEEARALFDEVFW
jgi:predicted DNA-binding WGR domain protein